MTDHYVEAQKDLKRLRNYISTLRAACKLALDSIESVPSMSVSDINIYRQILLDALNNTQPEENK